MKKTGNQHVVPRENGWAVKTAGASKATKAFDTKQQALDFGREIARKNQSELVIHGKNGKIQDSDSYGNDPCPPHDQKH
ncbi:MAG: DUF2188 domain-containing protein [Terriglobales bacterium]